MNAISVGSSRWPFLHRTWLNQSSRVDIRRILASRPSARPFRTAGISRELSSDWSQVNSPADAVRLRRNSIENPLSAYQKMLRPERAAALDHFCH